MMKSLKWPAFLSIAFALFLMVGGPLCLLQGIAWGRMLQNYAKRDSFTLALEKTFSGKYRCSLCQKIAAQKQQEGKNKATSLIEKSLKAILLDHQEASAFLFDRDNPYPPLLRWDCFTMSQKPPTPYPRRGALLSSCS